jgi:hypothetical protein
MISRTALSLIFIAIAALMSGCHSTGTAFNPPEGTTGTSGHHGGGGGSGSPTQLKHMYLSISAQSGSIQIYATPVMSTSSPIATLPEVWPRELFVDGKGRLFVPITGGTNEGTVQVYATPITSSSSPAFSLSVGGAGNYPEDAMEDSGGNVYVTIPYSTVCCIAEFAAEAIGNGQSLSQPSFVVPGNPNNDFGAPFGLAVDGNDHLFVSDQEAAGGLLQFSLPLSAASDPSQYVVGTTSLNYGVIIDKNNRVYVSNLTACGSIDVFNEPVTSSSTPAFVIAIYPGAQCGTNHSLIGMAFDGSGNLWVTTFQNEVWEVPAPISASSTPQRVLSGLPSTPWGIAFGP